MAIINKYEIRRYREVLSNVPIGLVDDGNYSTFTLDSFDTNPTGNGHFIGLIKRGIFLGEIAKNTLDTGNITRQQFNALTPNQVREYIKQGIFSENSNQIIGWVELARSTPSFYYQDCVGGKIPIVDNWYDYTNLNLGQTILSNDDKLDIVGVWDINDSNGNWGTTPYPNQPEMPFYQYLDIVTSDALVDGITFTKLNIQKYFNVPILQANKLDHFDGSETYPTSVTFFSNKTAYGRFRKSDLPIGFKYGTGKYSGQCISLKSSVTPDTGTRVGTDFGDTGVLQDGYIYKGMTADGLKEQFIEPDENQPFIRILGTEQTDPSIIQSLASGEYRRADYHRNNVNKGVTDPRELYGDNMDSPSGIHHATLDKDSSVLTIKPALLKEHILTSIPSELGPIRAAKAMQMRRNVINMYDIYSNVYVESSGGEIFKKRNLLFNMGDDANGNRTFSDSESFREKCTFTGYNNSFEFSFNTTINTLYNASSDDFLKPIYSDLYKILSNLGYEDSQIRNNKQPIPIVYRSKTGKYYYSCTPSKTILAGYIEKIPSESDKTKTDRFNQAFADRLNYVPQDNIRDMYRYIHVPSFELDEYRRPVFYTTSPKTNQTQEFIPDFYQILSNYVYKDDFVLRNTISSELNGLNSKFKSYPSLLKRREFFIPNPFDNLLWADMIMWSPNVVKYDLPYAIRFLTNALYPKIRNSNFQKFIDFNEGKLVNQKIRFNSPTLTYSDDTGYVISITDKTYITDVYFGLMEMHIKGYPWKLILQVMNRFIPDSSVNFAPVNGNSISITSFKTKSVIPKINNPISLDADWLGQELTNSMRGIYSNITSAFEKTWNFMVDNKYVTDSRTTQIRKSR